MKHGRPIVLLIGVALMVVGLVVLVEWSALGLAVIVIGLVAVVLPRSSGMSSKRGSRAG